MSDPAVRRPCWRSQQSELLPRLQILRIFKGPLNPKILTISVCTQYFAQKLPTQYSKEALLFHQTKDPIFNSQFPWKPENIGSKTTQPSANSTSDLIPKRSELEETRYRKKQVHFENNHWTKKNYRTREGKPISKNKKKNQISGVVLTDQTATKSEEDPGREMPARKPQQQSEATGEERKRSGSSSSHSNNTRQQCTLIPPKAQV